MTVFKKCYFWYFVLGHQFLGLLEFIWATFLFRSLIITVFIQLMKIELNWTLCTLIFKILQKSFCLFCKVNKTKTTCGLPCFSIELMVSIERLACVWKSFEWSQNIEMHENWIKSSSNELLGKPSLHDPFYKFFE